MKTEHGKCDELRSLIAERVARLGLELFDCTLVGVGSRRIVRVFVDKPGGVTIDDCEEASHAVSLLLDTEQFSDRPYTLEVSSPGLDRPLRTVKDFLRVCGEDVRVTLIDEKRKTTTYQGVITGCDTNALYLKTGDEDIEVPIASIKKARVIPSLS